MKKDSNAVLSTEIKTQMNQTFKYLNCNQKYLWTRLEEAMHCRLFPRKKCGFCPTKNRIKSGGKCKKGNRISQQPGWGESREATERECFTFWMLLWLSPACRTLDDNNNNSSSNNNTTTALNWWQKARVGQGKTMKRPDQLVCVAHIAWHPWMCGSRVWTDEGRESCCCCKEKDTGMLT